MKHSKSAEAVSYESSIDLCDTDSNVLQPQEDEGVCKLIALVDQLAPTNVYRKTNANECFESSERSPIRIAGLAIFREQAGATSWLLLQNTCGTWTPPKGHLEPGEEEVAAALRETREETGLRAAQLTVWHRARYSYNFVSRVHGAPVEITYILARLHNGDAKIKLSSEHLDYKWVGAEDKMWISQNNLNKTIPGLQNLLPKVVDDNLHCINTKDRNYAFWCGPLLFQISFLFICQYL